MKTFEQAYMFGATCPFSAEQLARIPVIDVTREEKLDIVNLSRRIDNYTLPDSELIVLNLPTWKYYGSNGKHLNVTHKIMKDHPLDGTINDEIIIILEYVCVLHDLKERYGEQLLIHGDKGMLKEMSAIDQSYERLRILNDHNVRELKSLVDTRTLEQLDLQICNRLFGLNHGK